MQISISTLSHIKPPKQPPIINEQQSTQKRKRNRVSGMQVPGENGLQAPARRLHGQADTRDQVRSQRPPRDQDLPGARVHLGPGKRKKEIENPSFFIDARHPRLVNVRHALHVRRRHPLGAADQHFHQAQ